MALALVDGGVSKHGAMARAVRVSCAPQIATLKQATEKASTAKATADKQMHDMERQLRDYSTEIQTLAYKLETVELAKKRVERDLEISQVCATSSR